MTSASRPSLDHRLAAALLVGSLSCVTGSEPAPTLAPRLGHDQPIPTAPAQHHPAALQQPSSSADPQSEAASSPSEPPSPSELPSEDSNDATDEPAQPSIATATAEDEALCRHITRVVLAESNNAAGLAAEQIDELIISCSLALAQDRRDLSEAEFRRRADCVREVSTVAGFSACKPR